MNDYITTTKQSTTKPCAYFLGYTVYGEPDTKTPILPHLASSLNYSLSYDDVMTSYDDVMTSIFFPHYWPFMKEIHRSPVDSIHKWSVIQTYDILLLACTCSYAMITIWLICGPTAMDGSRVVTMISVGIFSVKTSWVRLQESCKFVSAVFNHIIAVAGNSYLSSIFIRMHIYIYICAHTEYSHVYAHVHTNIFKRSSKMNRANMFQFLALLLVASYKLNGQIGDCKKLPRCLEMFGIFNHCFDLWHETEVQKLQVIPRWLNDLDIPRFFDIEDYYLTKQKCPPMRIIPEIACRRDAD